VRDFAEATQRWARGEHLGSLPQRRAAADVRPA
jgi:hypothetical protein